MGRKGMINLMPESEGEMDKCHTRSVSGCEHFSSQVTNMLPNEIFKGRDIDVQLFSTSFH